jgi:hypothetical protein
MNKECAAVRKKGSTDKCKSLALTNHTLCGVHARAKNPVLWSSCIRPEGVIRLQALVRGWTVRKYLKLCGPGVLRRATLANDDELVSCESKEQQYPFEFFSFEENGKIWWFDFDTIWTWCTKSPNPVNPYTKVPLTKETRVRLRILWSYRKIHKMHIPSESNVFQERIRNRWNIMCQVFEDNGFGEINPSRFESMRAQDYLLVCQFVESDLRVSMKKSNIYFNMFTRYLGTMIRNYRSMTPVQYILQASHVLLLLMCLPNDPYIPAFTLLSALYRM